MSTPITRHVLSLNLGHTDQPLGAFWEAFGKLVRSEWGRLGVRCHSPAILGYPGDRNWGEAWDDLQANAYVEAVLQPARELLAVLKRQPRGTCVDALVRLKVRRHFQACRAQADPVGTAVYRRVYAALRRMVNDGALAAHFLHEGRHLCKDTMLSFAPLPGATLTTATELAALLPTLPDWSRLRVLLACTRRTPPLPDRLRKFILALGQAGCRQLSGRCSRGNDAAGSPRDGPRLMRSRRVRPWPPTPMRSKYPRQTRTRVVAAARTNSRHAAAACAAGSSRPAGLTRTLTACACFRHVYPRSARVTGPVCGRLPSSSARRASRLAAAASESTCMP